MSGGVRVRLSAGARCPLTAAELTAVFGEVMTLASERLTELALMTSDLELGA